jgi:hypothetical protein
MNDVDKLLTQIQAQVNEARAALDDEHEGALRKAVLLIDLDATKLSHLVLTW